LRTVLVTGAAGFLGRHVCRRLAERGDLRVRAGVRTLPEPNVSDHPARLPVLADVRDRAQMAKVLEGCDAVVHCAVGDHETTVEGTRTLMTQAKREGVRRVVAISSIAVHGDVEGRITEDAPLVADGQDYAGAKAEAERVALALGGGDDGPSVTLLRPTIIYGPGSALWVDVMARRILAGAWATLGPYGEGTCNPVHVNDVAEAVSLALDADLLHGEALTINSDERPTWNAYFQRLAAHLGAPPLPAWSVSTVQRRVALALPGRALARVVPPVRRLSSVSLAPAPSEIVLFRRRAEFPADKAHALLEWRPRVNLETGLAEACAPWRRESRS